MHPLLAMRKTSQDGGDNTSITSSIENEFKKPGQGILKCTKNSIKRKVQNLSNESDDTANEPLLHKNKEKSEIEKQSAKLLLSKAKTDIVNSKDNDKDKLLADDKITNPSITDITGITDGSISNGLKDLKHDTSVLLSTASIHNHMNTNVFNSPGGLKDTVIAETQILVEVDSGKSSGYNRSPLIFTTAKIHTDGKMHQMEPVQVTSVPITSTIEGSVVKTGTKVNGLEKKQEVMIKSPPVSKPTGFDLTEKHDHHVIADKNIVSGSFKRLDYKDSAGKVSTTLCSTEAQASNNSKIKSDESISINPAQGAKLAETPINIHDGQDFCSVNKDFTKILPVHDSSAIDKNYTDIIKNIQPETRLDGEKKIENNKTSKEGTFSQKSGNNSSFNSGLTFKEEKSHPNSITSTKKIISAIGDDKSKTILDTSTSVTDKSSSSINKLSLKETTSNKVNNISVVKNLGTFRNKETMSSTISPEKNISKTVTSSPTQAMTSTTKNNVMKTLVKENEDIVKIANTAEPNEASSASKILKSPETIVSKINSSLPVVTNLTKSNKQDKGPPKFKEKDSATQIKPFDSKTPSTLSNDFKGIKSTVVHSASVSPQIISTPTVDKVPTADITKTIMPSATKTSVSASVSTSNATGTTKLTTTTTDALKRKSNNVSVVSSISKATTLSTKNSSPSSSSTTTAKPASTVKLTSPSTVKTISSVPTVKSSVVSSMSRDKTSLKNVSTPVSKQTSSTVNITDAASSAARKPLANKSTSTVTVSPSAKVVPTTSVKLTAKSTPQPDVKLNENSNKKKGSKI